jgi:hypothetical protein
MDWIIIDGATLTRIVETEELFQLKQYIQEHGVKCKVILSNCGPYFWLTTSERSSLKGDVGLIGNVNWTPGGESIVRSIAEPKRVSVCIEFKVTNTQAEKIATHKLSLTANYNGEYLPVWSINRITERVSYTCGVYKREGFDNAYHALKVLITDLTEEKFAKADYGEGESGWNPMIVQLKTFDSSDRCLTTYVDYEYVETEYSNVRMTLLSIDIPENMDYIKEILSECL